MADTVLINGKRLKALREKHALSQEGLEHACSQKKGCSVLRNPLMILIKIIKLR